MAKRFCSLWSSGMKLSYALHVENTIGCISSLLDCFSITKKFRESFPARQTLHDNFLINDIGNAQFYCKLKYTCMQIWLNKIWYSHCPDLFVYTSSSLAFFLMQWVKSTVIFPSRPCLKLIRVAKNYFNNFFVTWAQRNSLICYRIQQKIHETHKICLWLECIRSWHKEFAYLLYKSTEYTWNSQNLAS